MIVEPAYTSTTYHNFSACIGAMKYSIWHGKLFLNSVTGSCRQLQRIAQSDMDNPRSGRGQCAWNPDVKKMAESTVNLCVESICTRTTTWNKTKNNIARLAELNYFCL